VGGVDALQATQSVGDEFVRAGSALWSWCAERSGWDGAPPAS
jgi:hypothetical protein